MKPRYFGPLVGASLLALTACSSQSPEQVPTPTPITIPSPTPLFPVADTPSPTPTTTDSPPVMVEVPSMPEGSVAISPESEAHTKDGRIIVRNEFRHQHIDDHNTLDILVQFNQTTFEALLVATGISPQQTIFTVQYQSEGSTVQVVRDQSNILYINVGVQELNDFNYEILFAMLHEEHPEWSLENVHVVTAGVIHAATGKTYAEYKHALAQACAQGYTKDCGDPVDETTYDEYQQQLAGKEPFFVLVPAVVTSQ